MSALVFPVLWQQTNMIGCVLKCFLCESLTEESWLPNVLHAGHTLSSASFHSTVLIVTREPSRPRGQLVSTLCSGPGLCDAFTFFKCESSSYAKFHVLCCKWHVRPLLVKCLQSTSSLTSYSLARWKNACTDRRQSQAERWQQWAVRLLRGQNSPTFM